MLHILFLILKIIGIVIAVLLGLLLLAVLVVLFVPIRYRFEGKKYSDIVVRGKVTWAFGLVHLRVLYLQEKLSIVLRIAGYRFYDNNDSGEKKRKKKKRHSEEASLDKEKDSINQKKESKTEVNEQNPSKKELIDIKRELDFKNESIEHEIETDTKNKSIDHDIETDIKKESVDYEVESDTKYESIDHDIKANTKKDLIHKERGLPELPLDKEYKESVNQSEDFELLLKDNGDNKIEEDKSEFDTISEEKSSFFRRFINQLKKISGKIKKFFISIREKIKSFKKVFLKIKEKLLSIKKLLLGLWEKKRKVVDFFHQDENKAGIKLGLSSLWKILKHIGPTTIKGYIHFGTGDPATTGQALGVAAAFYGYYGKHLKIEPDFEEEVMEGELFIKGRIRLFNLLIIGIKLLRDENFKRFIKNTKLLKEELL